MDGGVRLGLPRRFARTVIDQCFDGSVALRVAAVVVASPSSAVVIDSFSKVDNRRATHKVATVPNCTLSRIKVPSEVASKGQARSLD